MVKQYNNYMNDSTSPAWYRPGAAVHCVGVAGVGMCALAQVLQARGVRVSGSDVAEEFHTSAVLKRLGIAVLPFAKTNIHKGLTALVYSSAYREDHPERRAALALGIPQYAYGEALGMLFVSSRGVLVSGTHGKTTTTALLGSMCIAGGLDPTVIVGGVVRDWGSNARVGNSSLMILEGDEYQEKFLHTIPDALILTTVDYDHPDCFPDTEAYRNAFRKLIARMRPDGVVITFPAIRALLGDGVFGQKSSPALRTPQKADAASLRAVTPALFGGRNRENMLLASAAARWCGVPEDAVKQALTDFKGVLRRMEFYTAPDAPFTIIDDYAHHPAEISATLEALRERFPGRPVVLVFQPHTFSRTASLFHDFVTALAAADHIFVLDVYASQRESGGGVSGHTLLRELALVHPSARYTPTITAALAELRRFLPTVTCPLVVSMGAGDVWRVAAELSGRHAERDVMI